jgi:hypothetical protein
MDLASEDLGIQNPLLKAMEGARARQSALP